MAQFGSALEWGSRGREFNSPHSDHVGAKFALLRLIFLQKISHPPASLLLLFPKTPAAFRGSGARRKIWYLFGRWSHVAAGLLAHFF